MNSLPGFLAADDLRALVAAIKAAKAASKPVIWGFGGHVVKVGLAPVLINLMDHGFVTGMATNGSGMIHDFEIAIAGKTSEDVAAALKQGSFGLTEGTGSLMNLAFREGGRKAWVWVNHWAGSWIRKIRNLDTLPWYCRLTAGIFLLLPMLPWGQM